jgi:hypothetical protein
VLGKSAVFYHQHAGRLGFGLFTEDKVWQWPSVV